MHVKGNKTTRISNELKVSSSRKRMTVSLKYSS
jgi:hypothetical protein